MHGFVSFDNDPAFFTMLKISRTGGIFGYWEFTLGPIQLSPGLIEFFQAHNEENTEGWLDINNNDIFGSGELLKFETEILKKDWIITFGSFQLKPGHLNFTWDKDINEYILNISGDPEVASFFEHLIVELVDKTVCLLIAFFVVKLVPQKLKRRIKSML